jgi:hypothetical protein
MKRKRQTRTIRELGGEIWAELKMRGGEEQRKFASEVSDMIMAVLARYDRHVIMNDEDFPVEPLPRLKFDRDGNRIGAIQEGEAGEEEGVLVDREK